MYKIGYIGNLIGCECICNHRLPSSRRAVGVFNLRRNCSLNHIGDFISNDWIRITQKRGNRLEEQRLQSAAKPMEESVTNDKRSLHGARCLLRKLLELVDHEKATTVVSTEMQDLSLEKVKVVAALDAVNAVGGNDSHGECV